MIVAAQAHGSGSEQSVLVPFVERTSGVLTAQTLSTANAGYHSEANLKGLCERGVPAPIVGGQSAVSALAARVHCEGECVVEPVRGGTCTAWFTTSRSWRIMVSDDKTSAADTPYMPSRVPSMNVKILNAPAPRTPASRCASRKRAFLQPH